MDATFKRDLKIGRDAEYLFAKCAARDFNAINITYNDSTDITILRR